ncbi:MAG TPA: glycosyltransferase family 4 protein [Bryobacteraceae bacterium]|nr:glycosyltransferase family 4 protein [Bryobacteraceae bacterium]
MRVLSVAFSAMPVGTAFAGGAEQILSILEAGLVQRGHESVVIASHGSRVAGELIETPGMQASSENYKEAIHSALQQYSVDVIHFHGLGFHDYVPECDTPMLATLHLPINYYPAPIFNGARPPGLVMNCVSRTQARSNPASRSLPVIPNGVSTGRFMAGEPDGSLMWLGRICPEKGVHLALQVAHRLKRRLTVAGPVYPYPSHQEYFEKCVKPLLDAERTYVGPLDLHQKALMLSRAECLLVPSLVAETSSLVAMEALSSGTPVVAFRAGALPEVLEDGVTGFIVDSVEQMAEAVSRVGTLSRTHCRKEAVRRFDAGRMIDDYLEIYRRITN